MRRMLCLMLFLAACSSQQKQDVGQMLGYLSLICGDKETVHECSNRILRTIPNSDAGIGD